MDVIVHTGTTKVSPGTSLVSQSFTSLRKERAFLLLQIKGGTRDAMALEQECIAVIHSALLQTEGEAWHRLDGTLKELNGLFKGFLVSQTIEDIDGVVAVMDAEGTLHVSHAGRGEAYLVRGRAASQITESVRGKALAMFVHISSGPLEGGDVIVLSTQRLLRTFPLPELQQIATRGDQMLAQMTAALEADREVASLATLRATAVARSVERAPRSSAESRGVTRRGGAQQSLLATVINKASAGVSFLSTLRSPSAARRPAGSAAPRASIFVTAGTVASFLRQKTAGFVADLRHPERKKKAHLLLLAGGLVAFLLMWAVVSLSANTQRSKAKAQLSEVVEQIQGQLRTAENRRMSGDAEAAGSILDNAERLAKDIINNESGLFRAEALNLLDQIHAKKEEIHNIVRVPTRVVVNVSSRDPDVVAQGMVGIADGEFVVFDRQNWYHVILNGVEAGKRLSDEDWIIDGTQFDRQSTQVFLTTSSGVMELADGQATAMKTEDPNGWMPGKDVEAYLRYLYVLATDGKIYKYERLSNRYSAPSLYNVNGDLSGALDMTIDGNVYILKENGVIVKLLRGEVRPFSIRGGPEDVLKDAAKMYKISDGNFYVLDPVRNRVIVATDGGAAGESVYEKQYILEGDQLGKLQDLYVDPDETRLYVMDEKRVYVIDLETR